MRILYFHLSSENSDIADPHFIETEKEDNLTKQSNDLICQEYSLSVRGWADNSTEPQGDLAVMG